jgi:hypothetical protein
MLRIPNAVFDRYVTHLNQRGINAALHAEYKKWLRYFLDFCDKYPVPGTSMGSEQAMGSVAGYEVRT